MKKPSLFGKYLLLERLNVGGMAEVFVAKAFGVEGFERILAIKKILPTMAEDEEFITMFIDEARISVQLSHANIVHIHELGRHDDAYYIAMEYVSGKDLRALLERFRRRHELMPTAMAVFVATKICEGLDYAHRKKDARGQDLKIIHRDVSPQNILLSYEGEVKIIDFGIAKAANRSQKTQAGILKGKFGYMSPEQVRGMEIDHRSDIFAMGVIMYEMLTGEKLFVGESDFSTLEKVRNAEVVSPRQFNPDIPAGLERVVLKALAREVEDRYQWTSDLQEDLLRFLLAGDAIYSAKHLAAFMKDAFAEDVLREGEKMERYSQIDRPDQVEPSGIVTSLPTSHRASPQRRPMAGQGPLPSISPSRPMAPAAGVVDGAGAMATGQQRSATINIPPPSREELEEMDASRDRTIIVSEGMGFFGDDELKTAIGGIPAVGAPDGPRVPPTMPPQPLPAELASTTFRSRQLPQASGVADTGHDLQPIEMTGFHPAQDEVSEPTPVADPPRNRPRLVIGDAPISAQTTIGPTPFVHQETRLFDEESLGEAEAGDEPASGEYAAEPSDDVSSSDVDLSQASHSYRGLDDTTAEEGHPTLAPVSRRAPRKLAPRSGARSSSSRRWLLIAIAATGVLALVVLGAALVKFFVVGAKSGVIFSPTTKVRYSVTVKPGDRVFNESARQVELEPGSYILDVRPSSPENYGPFKVSVRVKDGNMTFVALDFKAHLRPAPEGTPPALPPETPAAPVSGSTPSEATGLAPPPPPPAPSPSTAEAKAEPVPKPSLKAPEIPAGPSGWSARVFIDEPGVEVFVEGRLMGTSPEVELSGLVFGRTYSGQAKKVGFEIVNFALANPGRKPAVDQPVQMRREERGSSRPRKREPGQETSRAEPSGVEPRSGTTKAQARGTGKLACSSDPVDAEVIIDGKPTGRRTPVPKGQEIELPFGRHKVVFRREGKSSPVHEIVIGEEHQSNALVLKALKGEL